jgi:hypothetical protein
MGTLKLALIRSYIADINFQNGKDNLTVLGLPAALFFLNALEECALAPIRGEGPTAWPIPETDENLFISTNNNLFSLEASAEGVNWQGTQGFCMPLELAIRMLYINLRNLILPDREQIAQLGGKILDNPIIRHIFDHRYI